MRECTVFDEQGQILTGSYMDYAMPRAKDAPRFVHDFYPVSATTNPFGAKAAVRPAAPALSPAA